MVTILSLSGMNPERQFSMVVLPEPVPPEITMFSRALMAPFNSSSICGVRVWLASRSSGCKGT